MYKIQAPPEWGIEPVPSSHRILGFLDYFALWSSLGVGLLAFPLTLVDKTDNGFADIYSAAVSGQNLVPRATSGG